MAWQQASVCLLVSFLSAVVRGYGLYPGTLPDRLYRGFRIGFRHLYPGHVDVQAMVCAADVPLVGHGDYLSTVCGQYQCTRINFCRKLMLEVYDELFEQFFLFHKDIFMGFFLSWEDEYRDLFLSAKETMFFFLPPCWQGFAFPLARLCHRVGKTLP